jgi:hypothetical protein
MRTEIYEPKNNDELLERNFAERELAEAASAPQRWDGQGRGELGTLEVANDHSLLTLRMLSRTHSDTNSSMPSCL